MFMEIRNKMFLSRVLIIDKYILPLEELSRVTESLLHNPYGIAEITNENIIQGLKLRNAITDYDLPYYQRYYGFNHFLDDLIKTIHEFDQQESSKPF